MLRKIVVLGLLAAVPTQAGAETYLCVTEQATGFKLTDGEWLPTRFTAGAAKYVIKYKQTESQTNIRLYDLVELGTDKILNKCRRSVLSTMEQSSRIICGGLGMGFIFDTKTLRFHEIYALGYLEGTDEPGDTPFLSIGKCSKIAD